MALLSRRPLALLCGCLLGSLQAHAVAAEDGFFASGEPVQLAAADEAPLRLRSERRFNVLGKKKRSAR